MKKILALAVGMLLIPFTAFGMDMMSDSDMDSITGQSGVAITVDNIQVYSHAAGEELWYETSRTDTSTSAAVGLVYGEDSYSYTFVNAIKLPGLLAVEDTSSADTGWHGQKGFYQTAPVYGLDNNKMLRGDYTGLADLYDNGLADLGPRQAPAVLTIRVVDHHGEGDDGAFQDGIFGDPNSAVVALLEGEGYDVAPDENGAYIEIGLGTIEIYSASGSQDELGIYVSANFTDSPIQRDWNDAEAHSYSLGTIWTSDAGATTAILGGRIGITSYGQLGDVVTQNEEMSRSDVLTAIAP